MIVFPGKAASFLLVAGLLLGAGASRVLGQASHPTPRKPKPPAYLESAVIRDGVYDDSSFAMTYKIPFGWVDRTEVMRQGDSTDLTAQGEKALVRLAVFERPPEAPRTTINSAVVITLENQSSYPGLKAAVDYFGPLEQVTAATGFKVVNEPYEFPVSKRSVAREDFSKEAGETTMHQSCLVFLMRGYVVLLTFVADSDDAMDELIQGLSFESGPAPSKPHTTPAKKPPSAPR